MTGSDAVDAGIRSVLAFRCRPDVRARSSSTPPCPLPPVATDRAKGLIFATLAGIALDTAEQRATRKSWYDNLDHAVRTRVLIGQAQGILMARVSPARGMGPPWCPTGR